MLIQFAVKNYRSLKDEQILSMVKAKGDEHPNNTTVHNKPLDIELLNSVAIYGANASGKSNVLRALAAMGYIVRHSASEKQDGDLLPVVGFAFDENTSNEKTEFEIFFINEGVKYQYGFNLTQKKIYEEWLYAYPKGRPQKWFHRVYDEEKGLYQYKFSESFLGAKQVIQGATRSNALFLSTAVQLNNDQLKPVFNWFKFKLKFADVNGWNETFTAHLCLNDSVKKEKILEFMRHADFEFSDVEIVVRKFDPASISDDVPQELRGRIIQELTGKEIIEEMKVVRLNSNRVPVSLDFDDESDGTKKYFSFAGPWLDALESGRVLVIDELNNSLHPKLVEYLIRLFHSPETNPNNAQLIFTTHDTSVLNQNIFRRDQIWFCEKNRNLESSLYSLMEFSPRKDRENIESGYLSGRYGAVPFLRSLTVTGE